MKNFDSLRGIYHIDEEMVRKSHDYVLTDFLVGLPPFTMILLEFLVVSVFQFEFQFVFFRL